MVLTARQCELDKGTIRGFFPKPPRPHPRAQTPVRERDDSVRRKYWPMSPGVVLSPESKLRQATAPRPASESRDASEDPAVEIVGLCSRPRVGSPMIYSHMRDAQPCSSRMGSSTSNTSLHCTVMRSERPPPRTPDAAGSATLNRRRFEGHLKLFVLPT